MLMDKGMDGIECYFSQDCEKRRIYRAENRRHSPAARRIRKTLLSVSRTFLSIILLIAAYKAISIHVSDRTLIPQIVQVV